MNRVDLEGFPILRWLYGSGTKTRVFWRLILIFSVLHIMGTGVALWEGAFYIRSNAGSPIVRASVSDTLSRPCDCDSVLQISLAQAQAGKVQGQHFQTDQPAQAATINRFVGYGDDLANHFYYVSFTISFFLVWSLMRRFNQVFLDERQPELALQPLIDLDTLTPDQRQAYSDYVNKQVELITLKSNGSKRWFLAVWMFGIVGYLLLAVIYPIVSGQITGCKTWNFCYNTFPMMYYFGQFKDIFVNMILGPSVLWMTVTITVAARRIVSYASQKKLFHIVPLAPDGAGGLTPLGRLALVLFYIVIVQLLYIVPTTINLGFHIGYQILYPCFFGFAAFVFFWPLSAARTPMKLAKQRELDRLSQLINASYEHLRDGIEVGKDGKIIGLEGLENLGRLRDLYRDVRRMPVWPYDFNTLTRFSSIFAIPVIAFVLQMIFSTDSIFYRPELLTGLLDKIAQWAGN